MTDISNDSSAIADQVVEGTATLTTLADLGQDVKSKLRSLYTRYKEEGNREGCIMVDEYCELAPRDNILVHEMASLIQVLEPKWVKSARRQGDYYSDIWTAADKFTGGQPFETPTEQRKRLQSLMTEGTKLVGIDQDMTNFLSKRPEALKNLSPDEPFVTENQIERRKLFAANAVNEMSACAGTALSLLSKKPSIADASKDGPGQNKDEELRQRLLSLYANPESMTCETADQYFQAIHPAVDAAITECKPALNALKSYNDNFTTADSKAGKGKLDSLWLLSEWPNSLEPALGKNPSFTRKEKLEICHTIQGSKPGSHYEISRSRQKTGNQLLADAIQATQRPDTTDPNDLTWLRNLSRKIPPSKPSKPSKEVTCPVIASDQCTEADGASLNTCIGSDEEADHKDEVQ
jgi:hypothetical protein